MMSIKTYLSIITLNMNGPNAPIRQHKVADWIKWQDPSICCLQETHLDPKDTSRLKVKGWKNIFHANGPQKKAGVVILISGKLDFKLKTVCSQWYGRTLHHSERFYPPRRSSNFKYLCPHYRSSQRHKPIVNQNKESSPPPSSSSSSSSSYINSWRPQYPTHRNRSSKEWTV